MKPYKLQTRCYKNTQWLGGYCRNLVEEWGEWRTCTSFSELKNAKNVLDQLELHKTKIKQRIEYRVIKDDTRG